VRLALDCEAGHKRTVLEAKAQSAAGYLLVAADMLLTANDNNKRFQVDHLILGRSAVLRQASDADPSSTFAVPASERALQTWLHTRAGNGLGVSLLFEGVQVSSLLSCYTAGSSAADCV
jgi:hypothetical protein